ncbi:LuxR C-terminal-related transcriptional regulator [Kordiimonas pumila]|uniref:LuxR C-terminal-related transcriptional regulator n=1 Tax=Kordiimonas pumila TaxID=2161677 RepID=A0ABV7D953_9PROT|nr:LuxR C-terminal-related transcriptional regulator [Kordiimonas pumila]
MKNGTLRVDLIRENLLDRIRQAKDAQLILIQAPAGYGKSTLLRQLAEDAEEHGAKVAWITPVSQDADVSRFMRLFSDACARIADKTTAASLKNAGHDVAGWFATIEGSATFLFDEYDQIQDPQVDAQLRQIIAALPESKRIVIATRTTPNIASSKLKLMGKAVVLGSVDLKFDLGEAYQFMTERTHLGLEEVQRLYSRVDGWPAALQFLNLSLESGGHTAVRAMRSGMNQEVLDYLAEEVFSLQESCVQDLLLKICLPDRLCDSLVNTLTGQQDGLNTLNDLSRSGLFLDPVDGDRHWFRFHSVFGDFLRGRLARSNSNEQLAKMHVEIANWFAGQGMREMAVKHYLAAGDQTMAIDCLEQVVGKLIREERLGLVISFAEQIDSQMLQGSVKLVEAASIAYGFQREFSKAHNLIDWREKNLPDDDNAARAEMEILRAFVLAAEDRVMEMGEVARDAEKWLSDEQSFSKGVAYNAHAFWLGAQSQFQEAYDLLLRAQPLHEKSGSFFGKSYADSIHASLKLAEGNLAEATADLTRALEGIESDAPPGALAGGVVAAHLGDALYESDRLREAEDVIQAYLPLIEQQCIVDPYCLGMVNLGRMAVLKGKQEYAHEIYERLITSGHKYGLTRLVNCGRAELAREATLNGDFDTAERRLRALGSEARMSLDGQLCFVSSELEVQRITYARFLVHSKQQGEARAILQAEIRTATLKKRIRRLIRLKTLLAISLDMDEQHAHSSRVMMEALQLAAPGGLRRIFLDEGPAVSKVLNRLSAENFAHSPEWVDDPIAGYVKDLVARAGGSGGKANGFDSDSDGELALGESLTPREVDILKFLASGHSNNDLADRLAVSRNTVKFHLRNVYAKLSVNNRMQAVQAARHYKLID